MLLESFLLASLTLILAAIMAWPYSFVSLDSEQKQLRSILLARYGVYAQLSALVPILVYQLYRLAAWVHSERRRSRAAYGEVPTSPKQKRDRNTWSGSLAAKWRALGWWLDEEASPGWGTRGHLMAAVSWMLWLLFLCTHRTGNDYFHVTKRFGIVAASQFPIHYMLALKSPYSPLALLLRTSHEHLNTFHRLFGRIIHLLLILHGLFYLNYYYQSSLLPGRLAAPVPLIGLVALSLMTILALTSFAAIRRWSYRCFFILHLTIGVAIIPLLWFHHRRMRLYLTESLIVFIIDIAARKKFTTARSLASIHAIENTSLLELKLPLSPSRVRKFSAVAGQHVYLSVPPDNTLARGLSGVKFSFLFHPFTVADVSATQITLVLRVARGPMTTALYNMAQIPEASWPLDVDGPYGLSRFFPNLCTNYDRILLVAGGVGATFILPIYTEILAQANKDRVNPERVQLVWSVKSISETVWAMETNGRNRYEGAKIYVTGIDADPVENSFDLPAADGDVELEDFQEGTSLIPTTHRRPNFAEIVDGVFAHGLEERVAICVCGPPGMSQDLRKHVTPWVSRGRKVWWHDETFGW